MNSLDIYDRRHVDAMKRENAELLRMLKKAVQVIAEKDERLEAYEAASAARHDSDNEIHNLE